MTRERAIQILKMNEQEKWRSGITAEEEIEAVEMAIEALKREQKALELKPLVRNISGWNEVVNEVSKLSSGSDNRKRDEAE